VKPTNHLHLEPRSKNAWSFTSTPQYAFMAWCSVKKSTGTNLPFTYIHSRPVSRGIMQQIMPMSCTYRIFWSFHSGSHNSSGARETEFLFATASRPALGPTQPPTQWTPGTLSWKAKRSGREADHSPPSRAEVKNAWRAVTPVLHTSSRSGV
jgi:hypothetical protein